MIRGFARLGIVVVLLVWMGVAIFQWQDLSEDLWRFECHISPGLCEKEQWYDEGYWPAHAATPDFLALSENERVQEASDFYEKHVRIWEFQYFLDDENGLKQWMIATARLGTDEAPVNHWRTEWSGGREIPYRLFEVTGIVFSPRLDYILFNENALWITALTSLAIWIVIILATLVIRWVYRGFAKE